MSKRAHSEAVLRDERDDWWHSDYLALVAQRLDLSRCARILDVGAGHGHWGQRVIPYCAAEARMEGVDQEARWVEKATSRAHALGLASRASYQVADAHALPFDDATFDLVTAQTVVMHVASPAELLREMLRVLVPGGRLLLSEPSNLQNHATTDSVARALSVEETSALCYLHVATSRGRDALGRGDDSVGDRLPAMLAELGVLELRVYQNDRPSLVVAPYPPEVRSELLAEASYADQGFWLFDREDAKRLYEAGGGETARFDACYAVLLKRTELFRTQVEQGVYSGTRGSAHFLISGVKPSVP